MSKHELARSIQTHEDFPISGVSYLGISRLLADPGLYKEAIDTFAANAPVSTTAVVAIEARGFPFGASLASALGVGMVMLRKAGKLPGETLSEDYGLEYGKDTLEIQTGLIGPGDEVVIMDDVLATGGTGEAAVKLVKKCGAEVLGFHTLVDIPELGGSQKLRSLGVEVFSVLDAKDIV